MEEGMISGYLLIAYGFKVNYCWIINYFFAPLMCKYLAYFMPVLQLRNVSLKDLKTLFLKYNYISHQEWKSLVVQSLLENRGPAFVRTN